MIRKLNKAKIGEDKNAIIDTTSTKSVKDEVNNDTISAANKLTIIRVAQ